MEKKDLETEINEIRRTLKERQEVAKDKRAWHGLAEGL